MRFRIFRVTVRFPEEPQRSREILSGISANGFPRTHPLFVGCFLYKSEPFGCSRITLRLGLISVQRRD